MSIIERMAFVVPEDLTPQEAYSTEGSNVEFEIEVYIEGFDLAEIKALATSYEVQEQWGIYVPKSDLNAASGSFRARKTETPDGAVVYEDALKTDLKEKGKDEDEHNCTPKRFEQFKLLADQGLIKTRYNCPHELANGTKFILEVDVFYNKRGELVPWAKIDAEFEEGSEVKLTAQDIPFSHSDIIIAAPGDKASDKKLGDRIAELYTKYFRTTNVNV